VVLPIDDSAVCTPFRFCNRVKNQVLAIFRPEIS
jgi:hypothetical protein